MNNDVVNNKLNKVNENNNNNNNNNTSWKIVSIDRLSFPLSSVGAFLVIIITK